MRYSIDLKVRIYIKGHEFLYFAKNIGKNMGKNLGSKYGQKLLDTTKKSAIDESSDD